MTQQALQAVAAAADELHTAEQAQREAIRAAYDAGASLRKIAAEAVLSHEQVRRIVQGDSVLPYLVTVERRGVSPLRVQLLVRAATREAASELAGWLAERNRGGIFEVTTVRPAGKKVSAFPAQAYDDADL